jgi:hypothetical protein
VIVIFAWILMFVYEIMWGTIFLIIEYLENRH